MPHSPVLVLRLRLVRWCHQAKTRAPITMHILSVSPWQAAEAALVLLPSLRFYYVRYSLVVRQVNSCSILFEQEDDIHAVLRCSRFAIIKKGNPWNVCPIPFAIRANNLEAGTFWN